MKRILQKSFAWLVMIVAMFAGSTCAMAETETFDLSLICYNTSNYGDYGTPITKKGISVSSTTWAAELHGDGSWAKLKVEGVEADITQIVLNLAPYDGNSWCAIAANSGYFSGSIYGPTATWVNSGNAKSVVFTSAYDTADFYVTSITVTYTPAAPSTTFDFTGAYPASGNSDKVINSINLYHNNGTLDFAPGKTVSDIKVNNVSLDSNTGFSSWDGGVSLGCDFAEEGTYVLTIPAGTFVDAKDKTNTEFSQTYDITFPGFAMSSAKWTTFCSSVQWEVPSGYKVYTVSDIENGEAVLENTYKEGSYVREYCPVLVNGPEAEKVVITTDQYQSAASPATNYLYSAVNNGNSETTFSANEMYQYLTVFNGYEDCELFKLSYNTAGENLGFYWDGAEGKSLTCKPNKAFLVVPVSKLGGASSNGLKIRFADEEVTGINAIATESNDVIYNLQGQRVNATKAGVYVKNGKKFIVK